MKFILFISFSYEKEREIFPSLFHRRMK